MKQLYNILHISVARWSSVWRSMQVAVWAYFFVEENHMRLNTGARRHGNAKQAAILLTSMQRHTTIAAPEQVFEQTICPFLLVDEDKNGSLFLVLAEQFKQLQVFLRFVEDDLRENMLLLLVCRVPTHFLKSFSIHFQYLFNTKFTKSNTITSLHF